MVQRSGSTSELNGYRIPFNKPALVLCHIEIAELGNLSTLGAICQPQGAFNAQEIHRQTETGRTRAIT